MKIVFMGSSPFAIPSLSILNEANYDILAVYTQPARKAGRGKKCKEVPLAEFAYSKGLRVEQPKNFNDLNAISDLQNYNPDFVVVVAYGLILPTKVLEIPNKFAINVHGSFLPRWRGAAPINYAIFNKDNFSGVSIIKMSEKLDAGPILRQEKVMLNQTETFGSLYKSLSEIGAKNLLETLNNASFCKELIQDESLVTYAPKITKVDTRIDFSQRASDLEARVRGLSPTPGAWFDYKSERFKVLQSKAVEGMGIPGSIIDEKLTIACGDGALSIVEIQRQGKNIMSVNELVRGYKFRKGDIVNQPTS
jgi:methionyl-tRNA formyltransferase